MRIITLVKRPAARWLLIIGLLFSSVSRAEMPGVAPGIPEPEHRNVIVQLFNWRFDAIRQVIPMLRPLGYSHACLAAAKEQRAGVAVVGPLPTCGFHKD